MITLVVPTVPGRESLLSRCLFSITEQAGDVQVLVVAGDGRLGSKVSAAAEVVDTPYMTVVDDDDYLNGGYLAAVCPHLGAVDYVGFNVLEIIDGQLWNICATRGDYPYWGRRTRGPVPKGAARTEFFRQVRFGDDYTADRRWMREVHALVGTHVFVDRALYVHDWWPNQSTFGATAAPRDVGVWPHGPVERIIVNQ